MFSKSSITTIALLLIGMYCHIAGVPFAEPAEAEFHHVIGGLFDSVALAIQAVKRLKPPTSGSTGAVAAILSMTLLCSGCASIGAIFNPDTPDGEKLKAAHDLYNNAVMVVNLAEISGELTAEQSKQLGQFEEITFGLLQKLDAAYALGTPLDFDTAFKAFHDALNDYVNEQRKAGLKHDTGGNSSTRNDAADNVRNASEPREAATPQRGRAEAVEYLLVGASLN